VGVSGDDHEGLVVRVEGGRVVAKGRPVRASWARMGRGVVEGV
jgi:hypothetical protein